MTLKNLIIGIGNRYRGDDAFGCILADHVRKLALPEVEVINHDGEPASLIDLWQDRACVILVDAVSSGTKAGTIHHINLNKQGLPDNFRSFSTHAFGIAEAVELARVLNKLPSKIIFYGVEGKSFSAAQTLSPEITTTLNDVRTMIEQDIKESRVA